MTKRIETAHPAAGVDVTTRPGGHMGYVGVNDGVQIPGMELFLAGIHSADRHQCVASCQI